VTQCKECGAGLPDHAKFCLQCGVPVPAEPPKPQEPLAPLDFVQPALAGGMFLGFLSSIPFISAANCLCCMWVLLGGGIAATLLARQRPSGITYGDGAFVGVLSGLFGAVVGTIAHIPIQMIAARFQSEQKQLEDLFRQFGIEGPMRDWMLRVASGEISAATIFLTFFANLLVWSLFAMIGGILTVAILNKQKSQVATGK
jgi:hypothetical protein